MEHEGEVIVHEGEGQDIAIHRPPEQVLEEAAKAAEALQKVIEQKKDVVKMNGKVYLTFEDWQTLAMFYGLSVGVDSTEYIEYGDVRGFEAAAIVKDSTGRNVSRAEAMCLNDEEKWSTRPKYKDGKKIGDVPVPLFQLKSMAQTRACAKALRNKLGFVSVLAGYAGTPAEEMTGDEFKKKADKAKPAEKPTDAASEAQRKMIWAIMQKLGHKTDEEKKKFASVLLETPAPIASFNELTKADAKVLIEALQKEQGN